MTETKVALVIGAGDATGGAVARHFAGEGYAAVITRRARNMADLERLAETYWMLHRQRRSAWTHELDLRPWIEDW